DLARPPKDETLFIRRQSERRSFEKRDEERRPGSVCYNINTTGVHSGDDRVSLSALSSKGIRMFQLHPTTDKPKSNRRLFSLLSGLLVVAILASALVFSINARNGAHAAATKNAAGTA